MASLPPETLTKTNASKFNNYLLQHADSISNQSNPRFMDLWRLSTSLHTDFSKNPAVGMTLDEIIMRAANVAQQQFPHNTPYKLYAAFTVAAAFYRAGKAQTKNEERKELLDDRELLCMERQTRITSCILGDTDTFSIDEKDIPHYVKKFTEELKGAPSTILLSEKDSLMNRKLNQADTVLFWNRIEHFYKDNDGIIELALELNHAAEAISHLSFPYSLKEALTAYSDAVNESPIRSHSLAEQAAQAVLTYSFYDVLAESGQLRPEELSICNARRVAAYEALISATAEYYYIDETLDKIPQNDLDRVIRSEQNIRRHHVERGLVKNEPKQRIQYRK